MHHHNPPFNGNKNIYLFFCLLVFEKLSSTGSFCRCLQQLGLGLAKSWEFNLGLPHAWEGQLPVPSEGAREQEVGTRSQTGI